MIRYPVGIFICFVIAFLYLSLVRKTELEDTRLFQIGTYSLALHRQTEFLIPEAAIELPQPHAIWDTPKTKPIMDAKPDPEQQSVGLDAILTPSVTIFPLRSKPYENENFNWVRSKIQNLRIWTPTRFDGPRICRARQTMEKAKGWGKIDRSKRAYDFPFTHAVTNTGNTFMSTSRMFMDRKIAISCPKKHQRYQLCTVHGVMAKDLVFSATFTRASIPEEYWKDIPTRLEAYIRSILLTNIESDLTTVKTLCKKEPGARSKSPWKPLKDRKSYSSSRTFHQAAINDAKYFPLTRFGNSADNILGGTDGNNLFNGKAGNDRLIGKGGFDKYIMNIDGGHDVIEDTSPEGASVLFLGAFRQSKFTRSDRDGEKVGCDLVITHGEALSLTIKDWCRMPGQTRRKWTFEMQELPKPGNYAQ